MSSQLKTYLTPEEYLAIERKAEYKSEYVNGEMFGMAGASVRHVLIVTNLVVSLGGQLRGRPCAVYSADLRVRVSPTGLYTYPDVIVVCGQAQLADDQKDTLLNPTLIIEVLSDSTKDYDRGGKFQHYRTFASLMGYVLVSQETCHVERFVRQPENRWLLSETDDVKDTMHLSSIECELVLAEVYDKVDLSA
ncbi:MAG: Uma2 family endonuclease [Deltaproteobacteria bacterium]|nr:Uma2 family endonuclease [Deltaproteobacteria bacterium]